MLIGKSPASLPVLILCPSFGLVIQTNLTLASFSYVPAEDDAVIVPDDLEVLRRPISSACSLLNSSINTSLLLFSGTSPSINIHLQPICTVVTVKHPGFDVEAYLSVTKS